MAEISVSQVNLYRSLVGTVEIALEEYGVRGLVTSENAFSDICEHIADTLLDTWIISEREVDE